MIKIPTIHLMLFTAVLCTAPPGLAAQQSNFETRLRACASIENDGQRLSCYDQILIPDKLTERTESPATIDSRDKSEQPPPPHSHRWK